ncbi:MAG TPA: hypothetical protein VFK97_02645 [Candidatus Saccharimonadales bacterium]|nr:hypothetical protein [Candidatus Saccharimonadales bacterium]
MVGLVSRASWLRAAALFAFVAATLFFLTPGLAQAASQVITLTPTKVSPDIKPGSTYTDTVQVLNQGKSNYKFIVYAAPYHVSGEDYTPEFTRLPSAPNIANWFSFSSSGGDISAGQSQTIKYSITVPPNTQPGGYNAAIFAETRFPGSSNGLTLNARVGELVYIEVAGPVVKKGELLSWQSRFWQKPPLNATLRIQDDGGRHFAADITFQVRDVFGKPKYTLNTTKELLPQTIRRIGLTWPGSPAIGLFKVGGSVNFLGKTQNLPNRWVLVMSNNVRAIIGGLLVVIILIFIGRPLLAKRKTKKNIQK